MSDEPISFSSPTPSSMGRVEAFCFSGERVNVGYIPLPKLERLMALRDALVVLKGPLADDPELRENVQRRLFNAHANDRILGEVSAPAALPVRLTPIG